MEKSNSYIFIYSVVMVIVIATLLSVAAYSLKPAQQANIKIEKMQNILAAAQIQAEPSEAVGVFNSHVKEFFFIKSGELKKYTPTEAGQPDTFNLAIGKNGFLPLFEVENNGESYFVVPLEGNGLWGAIWGYISISKSDCNTVKGTVFDHASETAGLGAEITKTKFRDKFIGKQIFEGDKFTSIKVVKGSANGSIHGVDGISGSTKTCNGVTEMLNTCLSGYTTYFQSLK